jgi:hypothetical protein
LGARSSCALFLLGGLLCALTARAQISVTDLTSTFSAVAKPSGGIMTDPFNDQQTGQRQSDIMSFTAGTSVYVSGSSTATTTSSDVAGFLMKSGTISGDSTNTYMMFRIRFQDSNQCKDYQGSYVMLGADLNNDGKPDIFFGVNSTNTTPSLDFLKPGTGANTSPSTTSSASYTTTASLTLNKTTGSAPITFNYAATPAGDNYTGTSGLSVQNMYLTFAISYANLQQAIRDMGTVNGTNFSTFTVNSGTAFSFMVFTSQQDNAFNQDLYGGAITSTSTSTWSSLGAFSTQLTASGHPVPELSTIAQTGALLLVALAVVVWRKRQNESALVPVRVRSVRSPGQRV